MNIDDGTKGGGLGETFVSTALHEGMGLGILTPILRGCL